jgi:uncharacterized membrane protein
MPGTPGPNRPTLEDPLVTEASEVIGGPIGERALPHPWWTPVRVVLAVATLTLALGMVQKSPCVDDNWSGGNKGYAEMCYSDVPSLYIGRGFAERSLPYADTGGRWRSLEYPVVIGYFDYATTVLTHALKGWPDLSARESLPSDEIFGSPGVPSEMGLYFKVTAVALGALGVLAAWLLAGVHRGRPWDAMAYAASPALALAGLVNWDMLAICCVAGALWAWSRGRPVLSGALVGLGVATKLYPVFLLGALFVVCLRRRELDTFAKAAVSAALAWLVVNLPAMLYGFDQWKYFWVFNKDRGAELGSLWLVWSQAGHALSPHQVNVASLVWFGLVCVGVLALGLTAPRVPRIAQLAFLVVVGFLTVNKVYSPQYVLWLLPLAVLARPRWRDLLIWQAGEIFYFAAVWFYLGSYTAPTEAGHDRVYWLAILIRIAAELYLAAVVVRDVLEPWRDPVRADGTVDDPMHPLMHPASSPALPGPAERVSGRQSGRRS